MNPNDTNQNQGGMGGGTPPVVDPNAPVEPITPPVVDPNAPVEPITPPVVDPNAPVQDVPGGIGGQV